MLLHADDANNGMGAKGSKKRGKKAADHPTGTLVPREDLEQQTSDLAFAIDPLLHHISENFDEGKVAGLFLTNLAYFGGCDIHFSSSSVPHDLVAEGAAAHIAAISELDMEWMRPHLRKVEEAGTQASWLPSLPETSSAAAALSEDETQPLLQRINVHANRMLQSVRAHLSVLLPLHMLYLPAAKTVIVF